jgi:hypothetical protein
VARIALPNLVLEMKRLKMTIKKMAKQKMNTCSELIRKPKNCNCFMANLSGYGWDWALTNNIIRFCKNMETPIALIKGASRGARRNGLYAIFSTVTANNPAPSMATTNTITKYAGNN